MLIMSIAVPAQEPSITWTGSGTAEAPYEVSTAEELAAFRDAVNNGETYEGKTVTLTADITLSGNWTPIGNKSKQFKGTFEGGGHCIKDLNVNINGDGYQYGDSYGGLFGYIGMGGTVQNLGVTGKVSVILPNNDAYAGGIAGRNKGTIKNCFTTVEVEAWGGNSYADSYAGGIAGCNQADISNCYATGEISTALYAGGIAGSNYSNDGNISYCYATGKVKSEQNAAGIAYKQKSVTHCIALNTKGITSSSTSYRVSSIAGTDNYASPLIDGTWTDKGADKQNGADLTDDNFINVTGATGATGAFIGWPTEGTNDWDFGDNTNLPKLKGFSTQPADSITRESVMRKPLITTIASKEDLVAFREAVNNGVDYAGKTVTLTADITVADWTTGIGIKADPNNNNNNNKPFLGTFDGQGNTITLEGSASLFAVIGKADNPGGIVQNLGVNATITANANNTGGIVGYSLGTVRNCYTEGAITNESYYTGGIIGDNGGTIQDCYSTALCTGNNYAGGIVGKNSGTVQQCYATGAITGESAGGIAGTFGGSIILKNSIALNTNITGNSTIRRVGAGSLSGNYASPLIPGTWADKGANNKDGADLTEANFTNSTAGQGAFINWTTASWDFSDNTRLPKLKTTGLATDRVISGQGDDSGNMPARADFLELPIEISTAVSYEAATHKDKDIVIKNGGIFTIATDNASLKKLTIEEGGQVITQKAFTVKELAHPITLGNKWTAYGSPVNMNVVATTSQQFYRLSGYKSTGNQSWSSSGNTTGSTSYSIATLNLIATEAANVPVTLTAPNTGNDLVTIPADVAAPTGEALYTGIFLFHANPTLKEVTIPVAYILSDDGTRFERTDNAVVKPFQSYMVANAVTSAAVMELRAGGIPTANEPVTLPDNTFRVWAADGQLHLDASKPADISIYNTAGQLVRRLALTGQQTVSLPRGIYFVHSNNITYKVSL